MEELIREIEGRQHAIQASPTSFKWASAITAGFVIAVIAGLAGIDLTRIFAPGDRISAVDKIATSMGHLEQDVFQIVDDLATVRANVSHVAVAVGAKEEAEQKTEVMR